MQTSVNGRLPYPLASESMATVSTVTRATTAELEARASIDPLRAAESEAAGKLGVIKLQLARLEAERAAAGEQVEHATAFDDRRQPVVDGLANPVRRRTDTGLGIEIDQAAAEFAANDAQAA